MELKQDLNSSKIEEIVEGRSVFRTGNLIRSNFVHNRPKISCCEQNVHKFETDLKKKCIDSINVPVQQLFTNTQAEIAENYTAEELNGIMPSFQSIKSTLTLLCF